MPGSVLQDARSVYRGEGALVVEFRRTLTTSGEVCVGKGCRALRKAVGKNKAAGKEGKQSVGEDDFLFCVRARRDEESIV